LKTFDVIIIGAGAAGLFCAGQAGQLGKSVLLIDHARVIGEKIRISGGGRCNFTNLFTSHQHFLSMNPHFVKSALARYSSNDFIELVKKYQIPFHEKHQGQLFCDDSAKDIIQMLLKECEIGQVDLRYPISVERIEKVDDGWHVKTLEETFFSKNLVMATGGLPVPAIGASDFALQFAQIHQIPVVPPRAALVPLAFTSAIFSSIEDFAGLSTKVHIAAGSLKKRYGQGKFLEDLLITHKGLSGPAVLQASSYWTEGEEIHVEWISRAAWEELIEDEATRLRTVDQLLIEFLPARLAKEFAKQLGLHGKKWAEISKKSRLDLQNLLCAWDVKPAGTLGWNKAEVMLGGIDTKAMDSKTMMSNQHPGLFFIGECVDVTGHLGGHNFQWAWSSGFVCASSLIN
jgi:predicted Rossmann fold flavoprotein